jgi:hypothetical protein
MNRFNQLREQIDACRHGSRDLSLPALSELAEAVEGDAGVAKELACAQQFDRAMSAALHDVPIPAGLVDRLLTSRRRASLDADVSLATTTESVTLSPARARGWISRRWLLAGSAGAVAIVFGFALYQASRPQQVVEKAELSDAVEVWLAKMQSSWRPLSGGAYPNGFPLDVDVKGTPQRWQALPFDSANSKSGWSATVAAVDLAPSGRPKAMLFVVRSSARFSVPMMPAATAPLGVSGGLKAIAWQRPSSEFLYVLAVEEIRGQRLSDYLQPQPVAGHLPRFGGRSS